MKDCHLINQFSIKSMKMGYNGLINEITFINIYDF